jgi:lysyl-tRNA synthetase class 2
LNQDTRKTIEQRSAFWNAFRSYLLERSYIEVETPVLETTTGGADARPFVTHHNALDIDVFLRISAGELWQKKLLVGGLPKVFEIGRIFRNEGMSAEHAQDYTQLEFYEAYSDYQKGMEMVKDLYRHVATKTFATTVFTIQGHQVDLAADWQTYDYCSIIEKDFGINPLECSEEDAIAQLKKNGIEFDPKTTNKERAIDLIWKVCRKKLIGPGFLINVPVYLEPLAKKSETDNRVVERFQIILGGSEMGKGFSELNDPSDQAERFLHQEKLRTEGDDEAHMKDDSYVEALEYGMPPAFGFGVSERLFAVLSGKTIREAQIFPLMKPRTEE